MFSGKPKTWAIVSGDVSDLGVVASALKRYGSGLELRHEVEVLPALQCRDGALQFA